MSRTLCAAAILLAGLSLSLSQLALGQTTVAGTITDAGSDSPIENVTVAVSDPSSGRHNPLDTGTTNASGEYSINIPLDTGESLDVIVEAAGPDHAPARHGASEPVTCFFNCSGSDGAFTITEGNTTDNIDIALEAGGTISGSIIAADTGNPLTDASLRMIRADYSDFSPHFWGTANSSGDYVTP
ncbi:MAG: carboxypeptidase-like regulatory domain-containing protein, partial [Wenzhouxiangella sp.]